MFKKYKIKDVDGKNTLDFYVYSRKTRNGFCHEARMAGIPKSDANEYGICEIPLNQMYVKVPYYNRTWEEWDGQNALEKLWCNLSKFKEEAAVFNGENPFSSREEPEHDDLPEPDGLFGIFRKGGR